MTIDRRRLICAAGAGAALPLATPAIAQDVRRMTMVTTWGRGAPGVHDAAQRVADRITQMSGGALTVELRAAGELVGAHDVFDTVTSGQVEMYHGPDYWFTTQHPAYAFFTTVPFGMTAIEMATWYEHGGGRQLHDRLGEIFNLKSFLAGNTGAQAGGWYRRKIEAPEDFEGLRIRMPGLGGRVLKRLGAELVTLPGSAVYGALESGEIDATEWVGPWADELAGFDLIAPYYYTAGFHEPGGGLTLAVNRAVFDGLSPDLQRIIETAAAEAHQWSLTLFLAYNGQALRRLEQADVTILSFPDPVWTALGAATALMHEENIEDPLYREALQSYQLSLRATTRWISRSEDAYREARDRLLT